MSQKRDPDECSSEKNLEGNQSPDDKRRRILRSFRRVDEELMANSHMWAREELGEARCKFQRMNREHPFSCS